MTDRTWTLEVEQTDNGVITVREEDLTVPEGATEEQVVELVREAAERIRVAGGRGMDWTSSYVEMADPREVRHG